MAQQQAATAMCSRAAHSAQQHNRNSAKHSATAAAAQSSKSIAARMAICSNIPTLMVANDLKSFNFLNQRKKFAQDKNKYKTEHIVLRNDASLQQDNFVQQQ